MEYAVLATLARQAYYMCMEKKQAKPKRQRQDVNQVAYGIVSRIIEKTEATEPPQVDEQKPEDEKNKPKKE